MFGRPLAKALLMATFTYQFIYWAWVKMEKDVKRAEKEGEVEVLEKSLVGLMEGKKAD